MERSIGRAVGERSGGDGCSGEGGGILVSADAAAILGSLDGSTTRSSGKSGVASGKNSNQAVGSILLGEGAPSIADPGPTDPSCLAMAKATCSGLTPDNAAAAETPSWEET